MRGPVWRKQTKSREVIPKMASPVMHGHTASHSGTTGSPRRQCSKPYPNTCFCEKSWTETLLFQRREWPCSDTLEPLAFLQASKTATSGTPSGQQLTLYYSISQGYPLVIPNSGKTFRVTSLWRINCGFSYDQIPPPLICFGTQVQSASPNPLFTVAMESFKPDSLVPVQKSTIVKG